MKTKILILGGCGYIGSALYKDLKTTFDVTSVDLEWFGNPGIDNIKTDYCNLNKEFLSHFEVIILLAGHSSAKMCEGDPTSSLNNNVCNFVNLLQKLDKQKFIYASSSSAYGNQSGSLDESCLGYAPINYYDVTKNVIDIYAKLSKVEYYGLRFGTVCGASPNLRTDVMINAMFDTYKRTGKILLFNSDIYRPILSIQDLIRAIKTILQCPQNQRGIYNLASFNLKTEEIAQKISDIVDCPIEITSNLKAIINTKLQSTLYNYVIECDKFERSFNFRFENTVESIVKDLEQNYDKCQKGGRCEAKFYDYRENY